MTLEALSSNGLLNFLLSESLSPTPFKSLLDLEPAPENDIIIIPKNTIPEMSQQEPASRQPPPASRGKKRRRRKPRVCKNEEEAENQRITHIAVERNRRRQMNQHLSVLRSLMPQPFSQKVHFMINSFSLLTIPTRVSILWNITLFFDFDRVSIFMINYFKRFRIFS